MSSASAAKGTPESKRLKEEIEKMFEQNILVEKKFLVISKGLDHGLCEIPNLASGVPW